MVIETRAKRGKPLTLGPDWIGESDPSTNAPTGRKQRSSKPVVAEAEADSVLSSPSPIKRKRSDPSASNPDSVPSTPLQPTKRGSPKSNPKTPTSPGERQILLARDVAAIAPDRPYVDLNVPPYELRPSATLTTGQCFHWRTVEQDSNAIASPSAWGRHDASEWVGVLRLNNGDSLIISIKETPTTTLYRVLHGPTDVDGILHDYFQLHHKLESLYEQWSKEDPIRLARIAKCIPGVRILEQDPWECLVSFICSSNNNIPRITKMVNAIRMQYGQPLLTIGNETFYSFPSLVALKESATDDDLRTLCGMGYRSKYILATMDTLISLGGETYLHDLRRINDPVQVQEKMIQFCGVGRKVADCVALFSLRQADAIPVDTHVWNIARRDYDTTKSLKNAKSMTPSVYQQTGDLFRNLFRNKAGWAHSLLFVAELPSFRPILPEDITDQMDKVRHKFLLAPVEIWNLSYLDDQRFSNFCFSSEKLKKVEAKDAKRHETSASKEVSGVVSAPPQVC